MQAPSRLVTEPQVEALLGDRSLAGEWFLDPGKSSIRLQSRSMGLIPVKGVFREVSGYGLISADGRVSGTVTVAAASVDTKNTKRDNHLRSADFFDSANSPDIVFTAAGLRPSGQGLEVAGTLTVRDRTRPLTFNATASVLDDGEVWLDAEVGINRADYGLTWNSLGMVSMHNTLTIHAVFIRR